MTQPSVSKIFIYPIKSLDPIELSKAEIGLHSLKNDRAFAMKTSDEEYVNGKRTGRVNQLKADFDLENRLVHFCERTKNKVETFELDVYNKKLCEYLSDFFSLNIFLVESQKGELLDVPFQSSATVISTATYQSLQQNFPNISLSEMRLRFRANIEIDAPEAYWEERLINAPGMAVRYKIGDLNALGMTPRARCNVPPRNPYTGDLDKTFVKKMMQSREENLPEFSPLSLFGNMFHLSIDTYLSPTEAGKFIEVGDKISIGEVIDVSGFG